MPDRAEGVAVALINDTARIDLVVTTTRAEIYMNRVAFVDFIQQLISCRDLTLSRTAFCVAFEQEIEGVRMQISTDDGGANSVN